MAAPRIARVSPEINSANVSLTPTISVWWDQDLDAASVSSGKIYLTLLEDRTIVGVTNVVVDRDILTFEPDAALEAGAGYTVTLLQGVANILGEVTLAPTTWAFTTGDVAGLLAPAFTSPSMGAYLTTIALAWSAVAGADTYTVQISDVREFSGDNCFTFSGITETSYTPDIDPAPGPYYIRVRAIGVAGSSAWSELRTFAYKLFVTPDNTPPGLGDLWELPANHFELLRSTPAHQAANRTPAAITLVFSRTLEAPENDDPIPDYMLPDVVGEPLIGGVLTYPELTWTISGTTLTGTGDLLPNTTYTVTIPSTIKDEDGDLIDVVPELWFTTQLTVLYATPRQLRQAVGPLTTDYADDVFYAELFRASIETNANRMGRTTSLDNTELLAPLPDASINFDVVNETLARAQLSILKQRYTELSAQLNTSHRTGDFEFNEQWQNLKHLEDMIGYALIELQDYEARGATTVRAGRRLASVQYGPSPNIRRTW